MENNGQIVQNKRGNKELRKGRTIDKSAEQRGNKLIKNRENCLKDKQ